MIRDEMIATATRYLDALVSHHREFLADQLERRAIQTIRYADLNTFIITYGGFIRRPWGKISTLSPDLVRDYGTVTIPQFKRNAPRR